MIRHSIITPIYSNPTDQRVLRGSLQQSHPSIDADECEYGSPESAEYGNWLIGVPFRTWRWPDWLPSRQRLQRENGSIMEKRRSLSSRGQLDYSREKELVRLVIYSDTYSLFIHHFISLIFIDEALKESSFHGRRRSSDDVDLKHIIVIWIKECKLQSTAYFHLILAQAERDKWSICLSLLDDLWMILMKSKQESVDELIDTSYKN